MAPDVISLAEISERGPEGAKQDQTTCVCTLILLYIHSKISEWLQMTGKGFHDIYN